MPTLKDIKLVIAIYIHEHHMHPTMAMYLRTVLQRGKSQQELNGMSKEELWGLVDFFAPNLQKHMHAIGALSWPAYQEFASE
jgi:hypothetical protein